MPRYTSKQVDDFREVARAGMFFHPTVVITEARGLYAVEHGTVETAIVTLQREPTPKKRTRPAWSLPEKKK